MAIATEIMSFKLDGKDLNQLGEDDMSTSMLSISINSGEMKNNQEIIIIRLTSLLPGLVIKIKMQRLQSELLDLISSRFEEKPDETEVLKSFGFIFSEDKKLLEAALDSLDSIQYVTKYRSSTSLRCFWIVPGSKGVDYLCLKQYCSCRRFSELMKHVPLDKQVCKHLIAIHVAGAKGMVKEIVSNFFSVSIVSESSICIFCINLD
jgi:predicted nucleic acid-binding Zn finger protein